MMPTFTSRAWPPRKRGIAHAAEHDNTDRHGHNRLLLAAVFAICLLLDFSAWAQSANDKLLTFQAFVNGQVPIKEAIVSRTLSTSDGTLQNQDWWRFGYQDGTWYVQHLAPDADNGSNLVATPQGGGVAGASMKSYWVLTGGRKAIFAAAKTNAAGSQPVIQSRFSRSLMFAALSLGLPRILEKLTIDDARIKWNGLSFTTAVGSKCDKFGNVLAASGITGKLTLGDDGLPISASFPSTGQFQGGSVTYKYAPGNRGIPTTFTVRIPGYVTRYTFLSLELGSNDLSQTDGYVPSLFGNTENPEMVFVWSNSAPYRLIGRKLYPAVAVTHPKRTGTIILLSMIVVVGTFLALWFRRSNKMRAPVHLFLGMSFLLFAAPILLAAEPNAPSESLLTTNSPFVLYLQKPPWIKKMVFVENVFTVSGRNLANAKYKGWRDYTDVVAIQPSGMFLRQLPNPPPNAQPDSPTQRVVLGVSKYYIWQGNLDDHVLTWSSRLPQEGGSAKNLKQRILKMFTRMTIDPVRYFGFPPLRSGSFYLGDHNGFGAVTTNGQSLSGHILSASNDCPMRLRYFLDNDFKDSVLITYKYAPGETLPSYFVCSDPENRYKHLRYRTNWILKASYGLDTNIHNGYTPRMFFPNPSVFTQVLIESNGQRYIVTHQHSLKLVSDKYVPLAVFTGQKHSPTIAILILLIFLVSAGFFGWKVRQRPGKGNETTKK